jgi:hypothetical protein
MRLEVNRRLGGVVPAWLGVTVLAVGLLVAAASLGPVSARAQLADPVSPDELSLLARHGRFDALLDALEPYRRNVEASELMDQLRDRRELEAQRQAARTEQLEAALAGMRERIGEGRLDQAMASLIEAHGLSQRPERLLMQADAASLVDEVKGKADAAMASQDYLEALSLYHRLKLLYEDQGLYKEEAKAAGSHVRLLQLYVPERLAELSRERAVARGEDPEEREELEYDDWRDRIADIDLAMLRQTLRQASVDHVSSLGYRELMHESVAGMRRMLATEDLSATFEGMADAGARERYLEYLADLERSLERQSYHMDFVEAISLADRIIGMNDQTVRLPRQVVLYELTEGITGRLDDYSSVIWPADVPALMRSTQGTFSGVGIQISRQERELVVVSRWRTRLLRRRGSRRGTGSCGWTGSRRRPGA